MAKTLDLGLRYELHSMDPHCHGISLALYRKDAEEVPQFLVHTYSSVEGESERVAFITRALVVMLGMEDVPGADGWIRFPCKTVHDRALKRAFLDLCKLETGSPLEPKPLTAFDKKANGNLIAVSLGDGVYEMKSEEPEEAGAKRATARSGGFLKLCEMETIEGGQNQVKFPCESSHDELIGMLMFRAQNVRAAMREAEDAASRGILAAPSQQDT